jgi:hypothetical protein
MAKGGNMPSSATVRESAAAVKLCQQEQQERHEIDHLVQWSSPLFMLANPHPDSLPAALTT